MFTTAYLGVRLTADTIGFDPWDINLQELRSFARKHEQEPKSRFKFGSPCRFVRSIDFTVHVWLPAALVEKHPYWAAYLRSTSPRWGRSFRNW